MQPNIPTNAPDAPVIWHALLEDARWTPSPHNIQPWRVAVVSMREATLLYDPARLIPDTDPTGQFTTIGFGIFLEYLRIAASHRGLVMEWMPLREGIDRDMREPTPFFRLTLREGASPDEFSTATVRERRTSRLPYRGEAPVSQDCLRALKATADEFGHSFRWSQESAMVRWVLLLNRDTLFYDFDDPLTRNEVGHWIRFSQKEAESCKDGLAAHCMRMPGWLMRVSFHHHWLLNVFPIKQIVQWYYVFAMRGTTTVAWMSGPIGGQSEWIDAGRMMGRWWLRMSAEGVYLHPFGSIITNRRAYDRLRKKIGTPDNSYPFWMIVRMGRSDTPPASQRLDVEQILWKGGASCESD